MTSPSPDPDLLQLPADISQAAQRRQKIKDRRAQVQKEEAQWKARTDAFLVTSSDRLPSRHPLIDELGDDAKKTQAAVEAAQLVMMTARDEAMGARARQPALAESVARLKSAATKVQVIAAIFLAATGVLIYLKIWVAAIPVGVIALILSFYALDRRNLKAASSALAAEEAAVETARLKLSAAKATALPELDSLFRASAAYFTERLEEDAQTWRKTWDKLPPFLRSDWSEHAWREHDFKTSFRLPHFAAGTVREQPPESRTPFEQPYLAPLLGAASTVVLAGPEEATLAFLHGLIIQLATMLPYGATFTLLDPAGAGRAFPMQRSLPFTRRVGADLYRDLETILEEITRLIHTYLDDQTRSFDQLPEQIQANERYEFIFAANFPDGYDRRTIEALQKIAKNGPAAGKYLFIQQSPRKELPRDLTWEAFGPRWIWDLSKDDRPKEVEGTGVAPLAGPQGVAQTTVLHLLENARPPEMKVAWSELAETDAAKWWTESAAQLISAPVGAAGRDRKLTIWFGANREGRPCAHGILGAMPGSGKSNLYHVLICGLSIRYSPEELNLYLIDGKVGVEFQPYRRLPHARVVALHSSPELSRSVLEELIAEMKRRNEIFKRANVADLPAYAEAGSPEGKLPRVVLMIDEYQELFEDDRLGQASASLLQLAQQGRSSGIHLLLGSQRFGAVGMLHQTAIFGSIHLRMAMKMSQSDVQGLTEFGRDGKRLVEQCDLPGKIVINDQSGEDKSNEFGKVALLEPRERTAVLDGLAAKAEREWPLEQRFATVVFDGQEQPNFSENPQVVDLIRLPKRPAGEAWRKIATAPVHEQGFGVTDWFAGERPMALWLGQELNVHGQARAVLRRRPMENLVLVGDNQAATYGMLAGLLCSVAVNAPSGTAQVWIVDRAVPGTPWDSMLESVAAALLDPAGLKSPRTREPKQAMAWLDEWCAELDRRTALEEQALTTEPTWLLVLAGADRLPTLARTQNKFGAFVETADGEKLKRIYREGPVLGLHLVMTFPAAGPLKQVLDRGQIEHFKHRIVTQMAEADSFLLLGKDHAAKLQRGSARPVFAIYHETIGGVEAKFKPYTTDAQIPWPQQLAALSERLRTW